VQTNLNRDGQPIDNKLVAEAKRTKFKEMYKDYKINLFNQYNMAARNMHIGEVYKARNATRKSIYQTKLLAYDLGRYTEAKIIDDCINKLNNAIKSILEPINDNRKTTHVCLACKESIYGKSNRAKASTRARGTDHVCSLCGQHSNFYYNIPKTYFHHKG